MLDKISKRILAELQNDGRISNVELANRVCLSPAACLERVRKLQDSGYILSYTAQLNPQLLDVALLVFIEVVLDRTTPDVFDTFKRGYTPFLRYWNAIWSLAALTTWLRQG